jgi:hypothetical protein
MRKSAMVSEFIMYGAREALAGGMLHIEEQIKSIEQAVIENPGLAFDLAKTLIESVCKTILNERKIAFAHDDDLPKLFKAVTSNLPFLPASATGEAEARKNLAKTLGGLHTAVRGVCELRNVYGFASHGSEGPRPVMETAQALLAAQAADTIIGFLQRIHRQGQTTSLGARLEYQDNPAFNEYVDEVNDPVHIFDLDYAPSEVLFALDKEAYHDLLANFIPTDINSDIESSDDNSTEEGQ